MLTQNYEIYWETENSQRQMKYKHGHELISGVCRLPQTWFLISLLSFIVRKKETWMGVLFIYFDGLKILRREQTQLEGKKQAQRQYNKVLAEGKP